MLQHNHLCISCVCFHREVLASEVVLNIPMRADWRECKCTKEEEEDQAKKVRADFEPFDFAIDDWATLQMHLTLTPTIMFVNSLNVSTTAYFIFFILFKFRTLGAFLFLSFGNSLEMTVVSVVF